MATIGECFKYAWSQMKKIEMPLYIMEHTKYYIPAIEDICIGYECQWREILPEYWKGTDEDWVDYTFTYINSDFCKRMIAEGSYRTPYLTIEQITAEGLKTFESTGNIYASKDDYRFMYNPRSHMISVEQILKTTPITRKLFIGSCYSINELRRICKLLGINK